MPERYPDDASLLALNEDAATGVPYIATGKSPYYLDFRKLQHRLLRAAERANDLRVYQDGDLTIGVRPGRVRIADNTLDVTGAAGITINASATTQVWLDDAGSVQTGTSGLPSDRTTFLPLAEVVAGASAIQSITDLRGEAMLAAPSLAAMNLTVTATELNQALAGISANVTAANLTQLTAGGDQGADTLHRHAQSFQEVAGLASFRVINDSDDSSAGVALQLSLPEHLFTDTFLQVNTATGFLQQKYFNDTYELIGTVHPQYTHAGDLTASVTGALLGAVPIAGFVSDVILSIGDNIVSSDSADGVTATVKVNGAALTSTDPELTDGDGAGFVSTDQSAGTPATVKSDGTEQVQRGDILTVDLTRTANGSITNEPHNIAVLVVIRAAGPE